MPRFLKIHSLPNRKIQSWVDRDSLLLHSAFQVLVDFVEQENTEQHCEYAHLAKVGLQPDPDHLYGNSLQHAQRQINDWQRIFALYDWWKNNASTLEQPYSADNSTTAQQYATNQLIELVQLRHYLWT